METNKIYHMDCIKGMSMLDDNSVDLIIADPPYNLSKGGDWKWDNSIQLKGMGGNWNKVMETWDSLPLEDYWKFTVAWMAEAKRILKPTGSMWVFGTYHNLGIVNTTCQMLEIEIINEVIWFKRNAFPNLSGRRLTASHETLLWCHSGGSKKREYYFDYEYSKEGDFSGDSIKTPGKQMRTVWDIPNNKAKAELAYGKHPTQKPIRILDRMVRLSAKPGEVMCTPFCGSGSECIAAKNAGLSYIGFETESEYVELTEERLAHSEELIGKKKPSRKSDTPSPFDLEEA